MCSYMYQISFLQKIFLASDVCATIGGGNKGEKCIFPINYNGVMYDHCITNNVTLERVPWCSTLANKKQQHVKNQGRWGYCGITCPLPKEYGMFLNEEL